MKSKRQALTYAPSPAIAYREIEGQILVLLPDDPELRTFNAAAAFIWKRLARRTALPRIVDELAREFGRGTRARSRRCASCATWRQGLLKHSALRIVGTSTGWRRSPIGTSSGGAERTALAT
jgi:hypothetical protein